MSKHLELAGFVDPSGNLGRPVPSGQIWIPSEVSHEGDSICWNGETGDFTPVSPTMLNEFVRLSDARSILQFAKRWGVLALSQAPAEPLNPKRGQRVQGDRTGLSVFPAYKGTVLQPCRGDLSYGCEPIEGWLYYARRASSVLNIAAAVKQNKLGDLADWNQIGAYLRPGNMMESDFVASLEAHIARHKFGMPLSIALLSPATEIQDAREFISGEIAIWLDCWKCGRKEHLSDFSLRWNREEQRWKVEYDYHGFLFPAIALQLALVVADADSLFSCSGCGHPYIRSRSKKRPKPGWRNYCDVCANEGVATRKATETYRAKLTQIRRLYAEGASISKIAEQLEIDVDRVSRWLEQGGKREKTKTRK